MGKDEVLGEIMTDKVSVEFHSPASGIVRNLHLPEEAAVKVGTVIVGTVIALLESPAREPGSEKGDLRLLSSADALVLRGLQQIRA